MFYQELDINLFDSSGPPQWAYITQGDAIFGGFKFNVIDGNEYWDIPSGTIFYLNGSRPDGHVFSYPCTWSGHTVSCSVEESMSDYAGEVPCTLAAFNSSGGSVGSSEIIVFVKKNSASDAKLTTNDFKSIQAALSAAAKITSGTKVSYASSTESVVFTG